MVHSVDDVIETESDELQRSLMPARIESDDPRVAGELERAHGASRRHEPQDGDHPLPEPLDAGTDGKLRAVGLDRVLQQHVEQALFPVQLRIYRQPRACEDVGERLVI